MKTIILIIVGVSLIVSTAFSQLKQEGKLDGKYKTLQVDNGEVKYLKYNKKETTLQIFNLDNSIWKTVKLPLPKGQHLDEIKMVSINTFNKDALVEIMYTSYDFNYSYEIENTDDFPAEIHFTLNLINENGNVLLEVPDSNDMEIFDANGTKKLVVYKHNGEAFDEMDQTLVYSLP